MVGPDLSRGVSLETMREILKLSPFNAFLGAEIRALENGFSELVVPLRKDLTQYHGFAHGAVVGAVADVACAWAAASLAGSVVTSEYKLNFLAPAVGDLLLGRGRVIKYSRRQIICRSDVFAVTGGEEKHVAAALATIMPTVEP
ncbi:MAG: PaaI family thioesterase [Pseudomonadota bacterium]